MRFFIPKFKKTKGFTILEMLMATGISAIVITTALSSVGSIYFTQKKVQFAHDFYAENRFLMERIAQTIRNNTIDYDRFFEVEGPPVVDCAASGGFDSRQVPSSGSLDNTATNRALLGYNSIFYWDTNGDGDQDRNLGGKESDGSDDDCVQAWDGSTSVDTLYLINSGRTLRTSITRNSGTDRVEAERQLTADIDGDNVGDIWAPNDANGDGDFTDLGATPDANLVWDSINSVCEIHYDADFDNTLALTEQFPVLGDSTDEDACNRGHSATAISPSPIQVNSLTFMPGPNRDPFLNFRIDAAQVHPYVFMYLKTELNDPSSYGFDDTNKPELDFQTSVSSRVFGDIRR